MVKGNIMRKERNIGIDLLRIVSMCMIIMIHMNGYGKASENIDAFSLNCFLAQILNFLIACSVNCYALISGFVNCAKMEEKNSLHQFLKLWWQVLFYSIVIMLVFKGLYPDEISKRQTLEAFLPATSIQYWYFTFYIPVLFLMPYLNFFIEKINIFSMRKMIGLLFILFSLIPWIFQTDWFGLKGGFSTFWLIILYLFGGWIRKELDYKESWLKVCQTRCLLLVLGALIMIQIILRFGLDRIGVMIGTENILMHDFSSYTSPFVVAEAVALTLLFARLKFPGDKIRTLISKMGATSFGVYLIHDNQFIRNYVMMDKLTGIGQLNSIVYLAAMVGIAIGIYVCCSIIELLRAWIFRRIGIMWNNHCTFIDE